MSTDRLSETKQARDIAMENWNRAIACLGEAKEAEQVARDKWLEAEKEYTTEKVKKDLSDD